MTTLVLADLGPLAQLRAGRLTRRIPQLLLGLVLYGVSLGLMVRGGLGLAPWDVLHSGVARHLRLTLGETVMVISVVVLIAWIPLRERPGVGTVANALLIGPSADATLALLHQPTSLPVRVAFTAVGIALCGFATAFYIGAQFGRGPRDGLMTALARRTGWSLRVVRTGLELSVIVVGLALGGSLGLGTIAFAVLIGPLAQHWLPACMVPVQARAMASRASR